MVVTNTDDTVNGSQTAAKTSSVATVTVAAKSYGINISPATHTFTTAKSGYTAPAPYTVTVTNTGNVETGDLTVTLVDTNGAFEFSIDEETPLDSLASASAISDGDSTTFTVAPVSGLSPGNYSATVTLENTEETVSGSFAVSFTVNPLVNAAPPGIGAQPANASYIAGAAAAQLTVTANLRDDGELSYQWYSTSAAVSSGGTASGGTAIDDAKEAKYTPPTATAGTYYYYVVVTNTNYDVNGVKTATVTSDVATISVRARSTSTGSSGGSSSAPAPDEIADGETPLATIGDGATPLSGFISERVAYITGYPDGTVHPDGSLTRAEVAAVLFRLLSDDAKNDPLPFDFTDIENGKWYSQAIAYLTSIGILTGYGDGTFKPNEPITRAEFAAVISRFDESAAAGAALNFSDVPETHWAFGAISKAVEKSWLNGYPDGTFKPQNAITRAEAVTVINNMLNRELAAADFPADAPRFSDLAESHWAYADVIEAAYDWAAVAEAAEEAEEEAEAGDTEAGDAEKTDTEAAEQEKAESAGDTASE